MFIRSACILALVTVGATACSSAGPQSHPANEQIQQEITEIVRAVRTASGTALYANLRRLVAYDVFAVKQVSALAQDPNPRLRSNALWVLAQIQDPGYPHENEVIEAALREALDDGDPLVRYEAAAGLAARNRWDVLPLLIDGLDQPDSGVRYRCHEQLLATTSCDFGFTVDGPDAERRTAIERWRAWYAGWKQSNG